MLLGLQVAAGLLGAAVPAPDEDAGPSFRLGRHHPGGYGPADSRRGGSGARGTRAKPRIRWLRAVPGGGFGGARWMLWLATAALWEIAFPWLRVPSSSGREVYWVFLRRRYRLVHRVRCISVF